MRALVRSSRCGRDLDRIPSDPWNSFDASSYPISGYRAVFNFLKDRVDAENRLLVAPYAISSAGGERRGNERGYKCRSEHESPCRARLLRSLHDHDVCGLFADEVCEVGSRVDLR